MMQEVAIFLSSSICELVDLNVPITLVAGEGVCLLPVWEFDNLAMFLVHIAKNCGAHTSLTMVKDPV